jgi:hypothetical protein
MMAAPGTSSRSRRALFLKTVKCRHRLSITTGKSNQHILVNFSIKFNLLNYIYCGHRRVDGGTHPEAAAR